MELNEIVKLLEQREQLVGELRSRLTAVMEAEKALRQELGAALKDTPPKAPMDPPYNPVPRLRNSTKTAEILEKSYEILRSAESYELPMSVREICARLEAQGVRIGGKVPHGNLSAKLGRDARFHTEGRGGNGWSLANTAVPPMPARPESATPPRLFGGDSPAGEMQQEKDGRREFPPAGKMTPRW